jgi:hypothetical protein
MFTPVPAGTGVFCHRLEIDFFQRVYGFFMILPGDMVKYRYKTGAVEKADAVEDFADNPTADS